MSESDETTRVIRRKNVPPSPEPADPEKTEKPRGRAATPPPLPFAKPVPSPVAVDDDEKTRVYRSPAAVESTPAVADSAPSPTVGWLIVLAGPGRGASMTLTCGMNHIGRSASNRIIVDFGDEEISRKTHTTLTYDPRGRKFYLQPGPDATNLTYLGEESSLLPVLTPVEITGGETIAIGRTKFKFIPLCGAQFSWD